MEEKENREDEKEEAQKTIEDRAQAGERFGEQGIVAPPPGREEASGKSSGGVLRANSHKLVVPLLIAVIVLLIAVTALSAILIARGCGEPRCPKANLAIPERPFLERREKLFERREEILDRLGDLKEALGVKELTGEVVSVEEGAITVKTDSGDVRVRITDRTRYTMMGRLKKSKDLSKPLIENGDKVRVFAREAEDGQLEAFVVRAILKD